MEDLTDIHQKAITELQYVLDLSGFRHNIAYEMIGIHFPSFYLNLKDYGMKQIMYTAVVDLTECLKAELATGNYPSCIDRDNEKEQIKKLYDNWLINNKH